MGIDRQAIFTKVYLGLKSQGFNQSVDPYTGECLYRGDDYCRCVIGWLIPDDRYDPKIEGVVVHDTVVLHALDMEDIDDDDLDLLVDLQHVHDEEGVTPRQMKSGLRQLADNYGLRVP